MGAGRKPGPGDRASNRHRILALERNSSGRIEIPNRRRDRDLIQPSLKLARTFRFQTSSEAEQILTAIKLEWHRLLRTSMSVFGLCFKSCPATPRPASVPRHSLVKAPPSDYCLSMLRSCAVVAAVLAWSLASALADTIQLKDKAAITGKVLAEKKDQIAVDVGYTVLVIPRNQIVTIVRSENPETAPKRGRGQKAATAATAAETVEAKPGFYSTPGRSTPVRTVLELVNQIGEAVVQVRTPGGLGSGFFLNEDGFLITNFHVIEGETQIAVEVYHQKDGQLDRKTYKQVRIIALNKFADLALLKVDDKDAPRFKSVPLGSADAFVRRRAGVRHRQPARLGADGH